MAFAKTGSEQIGSAELKCVASVVKPSKRVRMVASAAPAAVTPPVPSSATSVATYTGLVLGVVKTPTFAVTIHAEMYDWLRGVMVGFGPTEGCAPSFTSVPEYVTKSPTSRGAMRQGSGPTMAAVQ